MADVIKRTESVEYFEEEIENKNPYPEVYYDAFGTPVTVEPGGKAVIIRARVVVGSNEGSIEVKVTSGNRQTDNGEKVLMEKKKNGSRLRDSNRKSKSRSGKSKRR